jgi:nucleoid DNA-binding protein
VTEFKGIPGIEEHLSRSDHLPIRVDDLDYIVQGIVAHCGLTEAQAQRVLALFFEEIRGCMLRGEIVDIMGFGEFFISSPLVTGNKSKIFPKFKAKKALLNKLNGPANG